MMTSFKEKYRVESSRLKEWDYKTPGYYFVTICTKNQVPWFGEVREGKIYLSATGMIAHSHWETIPDHFPYSDLDTFVIMPNHIHGIIILTTPSVETLHATSRNHATSLPPRDTPMGKISPKPGSLSTIIRSYKAAVTRQLHYMF